MSSDIRSSFQDLDYPPFFILPNGRPSGTWTSPSVPLQGEREAGLKCLYSSNVLTHQVFSTISRFLRVGFDAKPLSSDIRSSLRDLDLTLGPSPRGEGGRDKCLCSSNMLTRQVLSTHQQFLKRDLAPTSEVSKRGTLISIKLISFSPIGTAL